MKVSDNQKPLALSDAVVEVAARAAYAEAMKDHKPNPGGNWKKEMLSVRERYRANARAALEAAWPMVVGEAVAYARVHNKANPHFRDVVLPDSQEAEMWAYDMIPLYTLTNLEDAPAEFPKQADFEAWAASIGFCVTGKYAETIDVLCAKSAFKAGYQAGRAALAAMGGQGEDDAWCAECGVKLELVRPGKHQHPTCSQAAPQPGEGGR